MSDFVPPNLRPLVFFDLETSGLDSERHDILDFAAVRTSPDTWTAIASFEHKCELVRPETAEPGALAVNGYSPAAWIDAEPVRVALIDFVTILGRDEECAVVAHNPTFDVGFVRAAARREGIVLPGWKYTIDTASMAWPLCVRGAIDRIGLERLCQLYGISNDGAHRAMADVRRMIAVYRALLGMKKGPR